MSEATISRKPRRSKLLEPPQHSQAGTLQPLTQNCVPLITPPPAPISHRLPARRNAAACSSCLALCLNTQQIPRDDHQVQAPLSTSTFSQSSAPPSPPCGVHFSTLPNPHHTLFRAWQHQIAHQKAPSASTPPRPHRTSCSTKPSTSKCMYYMSTEEATRRTPAAGIMIK